MRNRYGTYLVILFFTISCKNNSNKEVEPKITETVKLIFNNNDSKYLLNPPKSDTLCNNDIEKAKRDISKYNKLYIKTICFGCDSKPYETEIEEVLKKQKIKQVIEDIGCVIFEGQTQGCYSGFISLKMKELYGENYFSEIEKEAEKLLIKNINENDKIISIYDLKDEEKPKILNQSVNIESDYYTTIKTDLPVSQNSNNYLFADITFIIEKDGTINDLETSNWVNENSIDKKYKKDLLDLAIEVLRKDYNKWKPGTYKGNKVRTENTLRVSFE